MDSNRIASAMIPIPRWPAPSVPPTPTPGPLTVDLIDHTSRWQPYVPPLVGLIGSIIVAAAAFAGVVKSNRTNLKAIETADTRERDRWKKDQDLEREKWHRDNLLRLCSEALRIAREIQQHYGQAASACFTDSDLGEAQCVFREHMGAAQAAIDKVVPLHYEIDLLGERKVAFEFLEFREVAVFISPAVEQFHNYLVANFDRLRPSDSGGDKHAATLTGNDLRETLEWRRYYKAITHIGTAIREFQAAAKRTISPDSVPKDEPARRDPWPTPEGDPDLFYADAAQRSSPYRRMSPFDWNSGDTADPPPEHPNSPSDQSN